MESVLSFYRDGDYLADAAPAINWALANHRALYFDPPPDGKKYPLYNPINVVQNGQKLRGEGALASMFDVKVPNKRMINIAAGLNGVEITGLHQTRSVPAVAGGEGIRCLGGLSNCHIERNHFEDNWHAAVLLSGEWCSFEKNHISGCFSHSILGTNTTFAWHWHIRKNLITRGDDDALFFTVSGVPGAPAVCPVGVMEDNEFFSITGHAIRIVDSPDIKVSNVAIRRGFLGSTGKSAILLNIREGYNAVEQVKIEQVGVDPTGRGYSTPPSGVGSAVELGADCGDVNVFGGHFQTIAHNGIASRARLNLNGTTILNCGVAGIENHRNGVAAYAGTANVVGLRSGNTPGGSSQAHAMWTHSAAALTHFGCATENNAISPIFAAAA